MNQATSILGALYRRKHVILLVMLGSVGTGFLLTTAFPPAYVVAAEILVPQHPLGLSITSESGNVPNGPLLPEQREGELIGLVAMLRSRAVLDLIIEDVPGLNAAVLKKNLRGDVTKDGIVEYRAWGRTPEEAALIANSAVKAFSVVLERMSKVILQSNFDTFSANEVIAWGRVEESSNQLSEYLTELGTADYSAEVAAWLEERTRLESSRFQLEVGFQEAKVQRPVIERALADRPEFIVSQQQMSLPGFYADALTQVTRLSSELAVARMRFTDEHPEVLRLVMEVSEARTRAEEQGQLVLTSSTSSQDRQFVSLATKLVDMDILEAGYVAQRDALEARKTELDAKLAQVPGYMQQIQVLQAKYRELRTIAELVSTRKSEMEMHLQHGLAFSMIDPSALAKPERAAQLPTQLGVIMFSALGGLLAGIFIALASATIARMRVTRPY